jgi:hypothetical protein
MCSIVPKRRPGEEEEVPRRRHVPRYYAVQGPRGLLPRLGIEEALDRGGCAGSRGEGTGSGLGSLRLYLRARYSRQVPRGVHSTPRSFAHCSTAARGVS